MPRAFGVHCSYISTSHMFNAFMYTLIEECKDLTIPDHVLFNNVGANEMVMTISDFAEKLGFKSLLLLIK